MRFASSSAVEFPRKPMRGTFATDCCALAANGHATAAPPRSVMKSRLLLRNSIQKTPVESMTAVSSMRVRAAHGNSFDDLVGAGDERRRNFEAESAGGLAVDHQLEAGRLLDR